MGVGNLGKGSIGRIAERIVANELEWNEFLVRDLNLEGLAANVDLLAVKNAKIWQIQVKGSKYDTSFGEEGGWWYQYGYCKTEHIQHKEERMFNRVGSSFRADIVVLVCIKSLKDYHCIVLPADKAEEAAQINLDYAYRTKKADGSEKKPSVVWTAFYLPNAKSVGKREQMKKEQDLLEPFKDKWDFENYVPASTNISASIENLMTSGVSGAPLG